MKSAPIFNRRKMYHWLTQFIFAINRFHGICLVHNINQMRGLGDAPKHFTDPNSKLVIIPIREKKRFSNVTVCSFIIEAIDSKKRREGEATLSALEIPVKFRLNYNRALAFTLPCSPLERNCRCSTFNCPASSNANSEGVTNIASIPPSWFTPLPIFIPLPYLTRLSTFLLKSFSSNPV